MTPEGTVKHLAEVLDARPEFSVDDVYQQLNALGIPPRDADKAYKFTQIACGRLILDGLARFASEYYWLNASGDEVESGRIEEEPFFAAATVLLRERRCPWAGRLGAMSADVSAINDLLKRGSKPGNLQTGPAVLFLAQPTPSGMEKADQLILSRLRKTVPSARKPWWRFW